MKKNIIWGVVIILLIGAGAYYFCTQRSSQKEDEFDVNPNVVDDYNLTHSNPTSDWKTYTSKYGLTFNYPSDWIVKEPINTEVNQIQLLSPETAAFVKNNPNASALDGITYDMYIGIHGYKQVSYDGKDTQKVKLGGVDAIKYVTQGDRPSEGFIVDKQPYTYIISTFLPETEIKTKILSSFKFVDPSISTSKPSLSIVSPGLNETIKIGSRYQIKWTTKNIPLDKPGYIDLFQDGKIIDVISKSVALNGGSASNSGGTILWTVPTTLSPGSNYSLLFGIGDYYDPDPNNDYASARFYSENFTITK